MKKNSILLLVLFSLSFFSCEKDVNKNEKVEEALKPKFDVTWVSEKSNIKKILSFLDVESLEEVNYEVCLENIYNPTKGEIQDVIYVALSAKNDENTKSTSVEVSEIALLEVNTKTEEVNLSSLITNDNKVGQLEIEVFDENLYCGTFQVEYDLENKTASITTASMHPGPNSSCFYKCLHKKLEEIFDEGNWIDQAAFMVTPGVNVAWLSSSCAWDCYF